QTVPFGRIPLLTRASRGGVAAALIKSCEATEAAADGVVAHKPWFKNAISNMVCERPPRPLHHLRLRAIALALRAKVASQHFIDVACTPARGGECAQPTHRQFIHAFPRRR